MKQHPIPQNILDIEFKLFSHFTIREFAYIAIGLGFGVIFLYLMSNRTIPGWIAIPIFLLSSGTGAFLGLVPINDQKADVYLKNFIKSVSSPTLRVWRSDYLDHSIFKDSSATVALADAKNQQAVKQDPKIIGSSTKTIQQKEQAEDKIEMEESQKKLELNKIAQGATIVKEKETAVASTATTSTSIPQQIKVPPEILINNSNIDIFKAPFSLISPPPNSINISIRDQSNYPIPKAVVMIKDNSEKILQVKVSDSKGEIITEREYPHGVYKIDLQSTDYLFPRVIYAFNTGTDEPIKIIGIKK
jgi:hypothetical protein